MRFRLGKGRPREEGAEEERWSGVLKEVHQEYKTGRHWWQQVGVFFAWAGGFAGAAAVISAVLLLIVDLFSAGRLFTASNLSDWIFWSAAILMFIGLLGPTTPDVDKLSGKKGQDTGEKEDRLTRSVRKRLRRVYDPWRWRFWGSAILAFGLSMLAGRFA